MIDPEGKGGVNVGTAVVVTVGVVLIAAQAGVVAFTTGFGPFGADTAGSDPAATPEPGTPDGTDSTPGGSDSDSAPGDGPAPRTGDEPTSTPEPPPPYDVDVLDTEPCGNTCRDVTVRLTNNRNATAEGVVVTTSIYSGNTTAEDARVWEGRRDVGTLEGGTSTTATARVSLSYFEALSVERAGGWVTVVTDVESETATETFRERREVA